MKVWILTSKYNDYEQHGEYFEAVFAQKPTVEKIKEICGYNSDDSALHILKGGGRIEYEYQWYNLEEVECK